MRAFRAYPASQPCPSSSSHSAGFASLGYSCSTCREAQRVLGSFFAAKKEGDLASGQVLEGEKTESPCDFFLFRLFGPSKTPPAS